MKKILHFSNQLLSVGLYKSVLVAFIALVSTTNSAFSQVDSPETIVKKYFQGYEAGDTLLLKEVFHEAFYLSWANPWQEGAFRQVDRNGLLQFFDANWKDYNISSKIKKIKVFNESAYCVAEVKLDGIVIWTDIISLLKINNRWWIVSKVSEGERLDLNKD